MPAGLRDFAEVNPFTIIVDAMRYGSARLRTTACGQPSSGRW